MNLYFALSVFICTLVLFVCWCIVDIQLWIRGKTLAWHRTALTGEIRPAESLPECSWTPVCESTIAKTRGIYHDQSAISLTVIFLGQHCSASFCSVLCTCCGKDFREICRTDFLHCHLLSHQWCESTEGTSKTDPIQGKNPLALYFLIYHHALTWRGNAPFSNFSVLYILLL